MKKSLLFLSAAAAIALSACSKTEFVSAPTGAIGFSTSISAPTKAADITTANLTSFSASAIKTGSYPVETFFSDVTFTNNGGTFTSEQPYYWPQGSSLDFYAYAPVISRQVAMTDYRTFTVTPSEVASEQVDFIYANTNRKNKESSASGVSINFRHTESKISLKVKNSSAGLKFEVYGWKLAYLSKSGTFTYGTEDGDGNQDVNTDPNNSAQLLEADWSNLGEAAVTNTYEQTLGTALSVGAGATTAAGVGESFILIPQTQTAATAYTAAIAAAEGSAANGSYIALKLIIRNATDDSVIYSGEDGTAAWVMWPVDFDWKPGKQYTYVVDLAGGGFRETGGEDGGTVLDKILDSAAITFVNVTVDEFGTQDDIEVAMPAEEEASDVLPGVFSVSDTKKVRFTKGNLYYDGSAFKFETNQNDFSSTYDASHVSHFFDSKTASVACAPIYRDDDRNSGDVFFTNASETTASPDFTVNGVTGKYRILSKDEWVYLLKARKVNGRNGEGNSYSLDIYYGDRMGLVLYPDDYTGGKLSGTVMELPEGVVFLPAAGRRGYSNVDNDSNISYVGEAGYYRSSSQYDDSTACDMFFIYGDNGGSYASVGYGNFNSGINVRLITDVE